MGDFFSKEQKKLKPGFKVILLAVSLLLLLFSAYFLFQQADDEHAEKQMADREPKIEENKEVLSEESQILAPGAGVEVVRTHCTPCHSARLIVQNRATREGWRSMIRWMQETQNLWELGENEETILDYLSTHYPPEEKGRRENLKEIEWYRLEDQAEP